MIMGIKYDPIQGAIVDTKNEIKITQPELLFWTATHPDPVNIDEPKLTNAKSTDKIKNRVRASKIKEG